MLHDRIEINPKVMLGKPVIRGTRVPVELLVRKLGEGATEDELLDAYPRLTREDIRAALAFAADSLAHETIVLQPNSRNDAIGIKGNAKPTLGHTTLGTAPRVSS